MSEENIEINFFERMARTYAYKTNGSSRDIFGRRPATLQDFGRRPATPKEIADAILPQQRQNPDQYLPTEEDLREKGEDQ